MVPPGLEAAWLWSQLRSWLTAHLRRESPDAIRQRIAALQRDERELIERQVTHATWSAQIQRVGREEQAALVGWQQTIARLGKGRGRRAGELKREAQQLMNACRSAVPVWIMPLGRVIENFAPTGPRFGAVITDESSQMDAFGLLALLRAERAVVVGDQMQISPAAVGVNLDAVQDLIRRLLDGIPAKHLYDGQQSLYDLARRAFGGTIRLREHFRCMPEIIGFSNQFYNHEIQPLRDPGASPLTPPVVMHRIAGYREPGTNVNLPEAKAVAALIAACCQHPAYKDCTMGAISLLGEDQARLIYQHVLQFVAEPELDRRDFLVGDAYHFQGDERDVMFLSVVEADNSPRFATLNKQADLQRFNVAASRAKNQLWIVHSVDPAALHAEDMRGRLLRYFASEEHRRQNAQAIEDVLTDREKYYFQRQVAERILARGYRLRAEVPVGKFRIDLVVDGAHDHLAVECDGDRWHTAETAHEDASRQARSSSGLAGGSAASVGAHSSTTRTAPWSTSGPASPLSGFNRSRIPPNSPRRMPCWANCSRPPPPSSARRQARGLGMGQPARRTLQRHHPNPPCLSPPQRRRPTRGIAA